MALVQEERGQQEGRQMGTFSGLLVCAEDLMIRLSSIFLRLDTVLLVICVELTQGQISCLCAYR